MNVEYSGGNEPSLIEEDIFKVIVPIDERLIVDVATPQATTKEEIILEFCKTPRSREEIQLYIGIMDRKYFSEKILKSLLASGKILQTIPDKPTSPKQKYYAANSS